MDVIRKRIVWDMIKTARASYKTAIVLASKDISEVESLADRIAVLIQGGLYYIGTEAELRKQFCKGIQIYMKMKPSKCQEINALQKLRRSVCQTFPGIRGLNMHKYYMHYILRQTVDNAEVNDKFGTNEGQKHKSHQLVRWSSVFERMEKLRAEFDFEAYTISIGGLEQIFYAFTKKYRFEEQADSSTNTGTE